MFIVYMVQQRGDMTFPGIEGIFKNKDNAINYAKELQHTDPDKRIVISQIVDDSVYGEK